MSDERDSELNREFEAAFDGPEDFDFAFVEQRRESEFANFGFDPYQARLLREAEFSDEDEDIPDDFECDDEDCDLDHDNDFDDNWEDEDEWEESDEDDDEDSFSY